VACPDDDDDEFARSSVKSPELDEDEDEDEDEDRFNDDRFIGLQAERQSWYSSRR